MKYLRIPALLGALLLFSATSVNCGDTSPEADGVSSPQAGAGGSAAGAAASGQGGAGAAGSWAGATSGGPGGDAGGAGQPGAGASGEGGAGGGAAGSSGGASAGASAGSVNGGAAGEVGVGGAGVAGSDAVAGAAGAAGTPGDAGAGGLAGTAGDGGSSGVSGSDSGGSGGESAAGGQGGNDPGGAGQGGDAGGAGATGGAAGQGGSSTSPEFGVLTGDCGIIDAMEIDSPQPFVFRNSIDFGSTAFDYALLSPGGQKIHDDGNLGGSSLLSEVVSHEVLYRCEMAKLLKSEAEVIYQDDAGKKTDLLVVIDAFKVGVSVTRAYAFPPSDPYTEQQAYSLLLKKLGDIPLSTANVAPVDGWKKQILHVMAYTPGHADALEAAYQTIDPVVRADTILLITVTEGADEFIY